ncbi:MAG: 2-phospho-L-lactate guanylyltransferase [SAR324 cluster bacterium]|nr:2-phospho-L-lactate guanylyltransferase [SAR324 cluster bacterium]
MWAVIPVKNVNEAKHRLSSVLSPAERRELFVAMFEDVLTTVLAVPELEKVVVATVCPTASAIAQRQGASLLSTGQDEGQTAAVAYACTTLAEQGAQHLLMVPGDIPLVTVEELQDVLKAHGPAPAMTLVPARDEQGSNCVVLSPPNAAPLRFGANSYFPHLDTARKLGLTLQTPKLPGISLDIDTPEDLRLLCQQPVRTRVQEFLQERGIVERLGSFNEF